ncbi:MAG: hypothetical protein CVU11_13325 [Bacteroidetes bacterium HGW-Bacteroidetes-6]|jgi:hypothetical protein|nr:MAG: hypothetical protein CVU11_13325 [Bacteroidetes bacterium HGW-Bacteroidetes-6]
MKKYIILVLGTSIMLFSCKKDPKTISFSGTVYDPYQNTTVSGVLVTLQANGIVDGVYNSSYITIETATSDATGSFYFEIEESAYDSYRVTLQKDGYYLSQTVISSANISPENPYSSPFHIASMAIVSVHFQNTTPFDSQDTIHYSFLNNPVSDYDCCSSTANAIGGTAVDTTISCKSVGGYGLVIFRTVTKNNISASRADTIFTIPSDTVVFDVLY